MSLVSELAGVAAELIGPGGLVEMPVTFFRRAVPNPEGYDPINGVVALSEPSTWTGYASWSKREPTVRQVADGAASLTQQRALLVPGTRVARAPQPGDRVTVGGVQYTVGPVSLVGDADGTTPPLYRCEVSK